MQKIISGTLFIITAPSGAGKTSLVNRLLEEMADIEVSISYTTRPKRPSEHEGVAYHFVDNEEFNKMLAQNVFLEHAIVFSHQYGTSKEWVKQKLTAGIDVILEIDWQGAQQVKKLVPEAVLIFIMPPSQRVLRERLINRAQDEPDVIETRLKALKEEMSHCHEFDYLVVNENFQKALFELKTIIQAERLKYIKQSQKFKDILDNLLS